MSGSSDKSESAVCAHRQSRQARGLALLRLDTQARQDAVKHLVTIEADVAIGLDLRLEVEAASVCEVLLAERAKEFGSTGNGQNLAMSHPLELGGVQIGLANGAGTNVGLHERLT